MTIQAYSLGLLEKAIQKALSLDPLLPQKLAKLNGKVVQIMILPLRVSFYMCFKENQIFLDLTAQKVDTIIQSTPIGLIRLSLLPASKVRSLFNNQIVITGDMLVGQEVKQLFDRIEIDWEGYLAQFTGDVVAHQVGNFARIGLKMKKQVHASLTRQVQEYIQEETRCSPSPEEVSDFMNDVDELSLKVERLEAHLHHYLRHHEKNNENSSTTKD